MIFISHSSKDKAAALDLQQRLLDFGYDSSMLFLDSDASSGIPAGAKWEEIIYTRLKNCKALIILFSANWQESKWCFAELVFAKAAGKVIFPIYLQQCQELKIVAEHQAVYLYKEGEKAYSRLFNALDSQHLGPRDDFEWPPKHGDDCPFPGLHAFDETHAGVYFGRETETQTILEHLRKMRSNGEPRLLMIVGASGSGKSSLLKAGVLPRLKHKTFESDWVVLKTLRYDGESSQETLFKQIAVNLTVSFPKDSKNLPDWGKVEEGLSQEDVKAAAKEFVRILQNLTIARCNSDATIIIAIDQFEEMLAPSAGPSATRFLRFLKELLQYRNRKLLVIGTMRSDHLDVYEQSPHALNTPYFHAWRLGPFPRARLEDIIRKPASRAGVKVTDELVAKLKHDAPNAEALPLLAFTLEKLYRKYADDGLLELSEYRELGGMEGSIETCIKRLMPVEGLTADVIRDLRLSFVKHLAQVNDKDEVIRLRCRWDDLPPLARPLINKFVDQRLLHKTEVNDSENLERRWISVEVAHEAMFRCWKDLAGWLHTSADILRWRRDLRRDQLARPNWTGLTPTQLAIARKWPQERHSELTIEEKKWIKNGVFWARARIATVVSVVLLVSALAGLTFQQSINLEKSYQKVNQANGAKDLILQRASNTDLAAALKAMNEYADARDEGKPSKGFSGKSRWHEAVVMMTRSLERYPENEKAQRHLFSAIVTNASARLDLSLVPGPLRYQETAENALFSPDGRRVATENSDENTFQIWDSETGEQIGKTLRHTESEALSAIDVAFSPDSKLVVTGSEDNTAQLWNVETGEPIGTPLEHQSSIESVSFSPNGQQIITTTNGLGAHLWDVRSGKRIGKPMISWLDAPSFSPNGRLILTGGQENAAQLWDAKTGVPIGEPLRHESKLSTALFSPDGRRVLTSSESGIAQVWDIETGTPVGNPLQHVSWGDSVSFSPDGKRVLTKGDTNAQVWDADTGEPVGMPLQHSRTANSAIFSADGTRIVTTSDDNTARIWDTGSGMPVGNPLPHEDSVQFASFSPDGRRVVSGSDDKTVQVWDVEYGVMIGEPLRHESGLRRAWFSKDGRRLITIAGGSDWGPVHLWDVPNSEMAGIPLRHDAFVHGASISTDDHRVVTLSDNVARLWDTASGESVGKPLRHEARVEDASFSPDSQRLVTVSALAAHVWNSESGVPIGEPLSHKTLVNEASFSHDSKRIMTSDADNTVRIWDVKTGKQLGKPLEPDNWLDSASFSPNGQYAMTVSSDSERLGEEDAKIVQVWNVETGSRLGEPIRHKYKVHDGWFAANSNRVITISDDEGSDTYTPGGVPRESLTVRVWDTKTGALILEPLKNQNWVKKIDFSDDLKRFVTITADDVVQVWDIETGEKFGFPMRHKKPVDSVSISTDANRIMTVSDSIQVWNVETGERLGDPIEDFNSLNIWFNPEGNLIITKNDKYLQIWDAVTGGRLGAPLWHREGTFARVLVGPSASSALIYGTSSTPYIQKLVPQEDHKAFFNSDNDLRPILKWIEAIAGIRFNETGSMVLIADVERLELLKNTNLLPERWRPLANWMIDRSPNRKIFFYDSLTARQLAKRERDDTKATIDSLSAAMEYDATLPLVRSLLARELEKVIEIPAMGFNFNVGEFQQRAATRRSRVSFLRRYDLDLIARHRDILEDRELAELYTRAATSLNEAPSDAHVGIGPIPTPILKEALQAAELALELDPTLEEAKKQKMKALQRLSMTQ